MKAWQAKGKYALPGRFWDHCHIHIHILSPRMPLFKNFRGHGGMHSVCVVEAQ